MRKLALVAALPALAGLGLAAVAPEAGAAIQRVGDGRGNTITFDVRASGVRLGDYARILRNAVHGREIRDVRVVIVPSSQIASKCGSGDAVACYGQSGGGGGTIVVPAKPGDSVRHSLLHEYGHHVDASIRTPAAGRARDGDGTPRWWTARGMTQRVNQNQVAFSYALGWTRSVGEIFAEDYVQLHTQGRYSISWLGRPGTSVLRAIRQDVTGSASGPAPTGGGPSDDPGVGPDSNRQDVTFPDAGRVGPDRTATIEFGLLGPRRGIDFTAELSGVGAPASVRTALVCDGRRITGAWGGEAKDARIRRRNLGPADCEITLTNIGETAVDYDASLTLSRPRAA